MIVKVVLVIFFLSFISQVLSLCLALQLIERLLFPKFRAPVIESRQWSPVIKPSLVSRKEFKSIAHKMYLDMQREKLKDTILQNKKVQDSASLRDPCELDTSKKINELCKPLQDKILTSLERQKNRTPKTALHPMSSTGVTKPSTLPTLTAYPTTTPTLDQNLAKSDSEVLKQPTLNSKAAVIKTTQVPKVTTEEPNYLRHGNITLLYWPLPTPPPDL